MILYMLYCRPTDKYYIGQTKHAVEYRWDRHIRAAKNLKHAVSRTHLSCAIRKHGKNSFDLITLRDDLSSKEDANNQEKLWILLTRANDPSIGYNIGIGGEGVTVTPEVREKMRTAKLGRKLSLGQRQKISESLKGKSHSGNFKKGQTAWNKGIPPSDSTKEKLRLASLGNKNCIGFKHSETARLNMSKSHLGQIPWNKGVSKCLKSR